MSSSSRASAGPLVLRRRDQWEALLSPVRLELVEQLEQAGPSSIREMAEALGRTAHSLYHHVHLLEGVGIVQVGRTQVSGSREEAIYELVGTPIQVADSADTEAQRELRRRSARLMLRQGERDYSRALELGALGEAGGRKVAQLRRHKGRISAEQLERLHEHLEAIHAILRESPGAGEGRMFAWSSVLAAVEPEASPVLGFAAAPATLRPE